MDDEIELAILPTVPKSLSYEDCMLRHWGPNFEPKTVFPDQNFARTLEFLGISKAAYVKGILESYGVNLLASRRSKADDAQWTWTGEHAWRWPSLRVSIPRGTRPLLAVDQLFELMENASYGGVLAIAGYASPKLARRALAIAGPIRVTGKPQIGLIDFLWGSGHSVTVAAPLRLDMAGGQIIDSSAMAYSWDESCGFVRSFYRFDDIAPCDPPRRGLSEAEGSGAVSERDFYCRKQAA